MCCKYETSIAVSLLPTPLSPSISTPSPYISIRTPCLVILGARLRLRNAIRAATKLEPTWNYDNRQDIEGYLSRVQNDPAYKDVKAIKNNQIKFVSDKYRYVASHHIVDAVENFAKTVYPKYFRGE